jgi:sec-independent protein translocase protein TatB
MFDIGWTELVVIGIVALIAIGPKELPGVLRMLGQWMGKVRRMASEFQGQFQEAMREAEMADVKKQVDELTDFSKDFGNFDPIDTARKEIEGAIDGKPDASEAPDASASAPVDAGAANTSSESSTPAIPNEQATSKAIDDAFAATMPADAPVEEKPAEPGAPRESEGGRAA